MDPLQGTIEISKHFETASVAEITWLAFRYSPQITGSKQMIHKGFKAPQSSVLKANITSSHNQGKPTNIREFEVCDFQT